MPAGMSALALHYPTMRMDNEVWRTHHPEMVRRAEDQGISRLWSPGTDAVKFDAAMAPYMKDPFRGVVERRWLWPGEKALDIELAAVEKCLAAAGVGIGDIDLIVTASFFPDQPDTGNAAFLARALGTSCAAWNLESACSGSNTALATAAALVDAGQHRRVLCVISCSYSKVAPPENSLSWASGDGAAAFLVEDLGPDRGVLATRARNTGDTCGALSWELIDDGHGGKRYDMRVDHSANRLLRTTGEPLVMQTVHDALDAGGFGIDDVDFLIVNTPTAWYAAFCASVLGIPEARTISVHHLYANTGPVLMPSNLAHALSEGRVRPGSLAVLYSVGSVSSARAVVHRFGEVKLAPLPPPADTLERGPGRA